MSPRRLPCFTVLLLALAVSSVLQAKPLRVTAGHSELVFETATAAISAWVLCELPCADGPSRRTTFIDSGDGGLGLIDAPAVLEVDVAEEQEAIAVRFATAAGDLIYRVARGSPAVTLTVPAGQTLWLQSGEAFIPEQLPGFGQIYSRVRPVAVNRDGQTIFEDFADDDPRVAATSVDWTGIRNRYWAVLFRPAGEASIAVRLPAPDQPALTMFGARQYELYAGPVEWRTLKSVAPELSEMLFAALWDFLRALTFGMLLLLEFIHRLVGNYGIAIILLSLSVKVLMYPLTALADSWQRQVNETHTLLKPELDAIRREYKGEDAHRRTLAVYEKHGISQFYTFKSAAGFLIQIPVFIAAFDMLAENFALAEMSFAWIDDLAKPDRLFALPFVLPFFGGYLNLLPFLMTFLSALAALLQAEKSLSADLQRQQSVRLYFMSAAFFVLFYTFPAGMVLYWTSSNLFHLLKVESGRWFMRE